MDNLRCLPAFLGSLFQYTERPLILSKTRIDSELLDSWIRSEESSLSLSFSDGYYVICQGCLRTVVTVHGMVNLDIFRVAELFIND